MFSNPKLNRLLSAALLGALCLTNANAQLSQNPNKFLGNITTRYQVDAGGGVPAYYTLWNQITPENESKWGSVEGTRGSYNWGSDTPFNYAKSHGFTYKFHALVWGSQYPGWFTSSLPVQERYNAMVKWFDEVKKHYPDLPMIDVVNEAVGMHQQGNPLMKESLGGGGRTGYDWLIKAFELAHERWPNAILIYNDYNTFQHDTDAYIDLVRTLRDAGAPIDAYGCQSHDVDNISYDNLKSSMTKIQNAVKIPMYITELDINVQDDAQQKAQYQSIFPLMWEADYCAGVTIWGYVYGATWVDHSGLYKNGTARPAMNWLIDYMKTDKAKNAKSPFPGGKKQISLYIKPSTIKATRGDTLDITVRAELVDKNRHIDSVKLYVNNKLDTIMTAAPYIAKYVPASNGKYSLKAIVYADSAQYEREGAFTAYNPRSTYGTQPITIPGTVQAEYFDKGGDGVSYHDSNSEKEGNDGVFRSDCEGVDIVSGNGGKVIGYTNTDEWLEYTVNVTKAGYYNYEAVASSGTTGSGFRLDVSDIDGLSDLTGNISVPQTADNDWGTYKTISGRTIAPLKEGEQVIRLTITGSSCNIDKFTLKHLEIDKSLNLTISSNPKTALAGQQAILTFTPADETKKDSIEIIKVYVNGSLVSAITSQPFQYKYTPKSKGTVAFSAIAIDNHGRESEIAQYTLKVDAVREPFKSMSLPGTIQAEDFDKGGEGKAFHDKDSNDEGKSGYRSDNGGMDIVTGNGGHALGYTAVDDWAEYTVNITIPGTYKLVATVSSGTDGSGFRLSLNKNGNLLTLANISVPNTGSWDTYTTKTANIGYDLPQGTYPLRITITGANCNIDKLVFTSTNEVKYVTEDDYTANGTRYNLGGQRVNGYQNGISIKDGKKVLILK